MKPTSTRIERITTPLLVLIAALGAIGCGDDDRAPGRDGGVDSAIVRDTGLPDTSRDAGVDTGRDTGPGDSGFDSTPPPVCSAPDPGGDCVLRVPLGTFGPLTTNCLPRCSAVTAATYRACDNQRCRNTAVDDDTTTGISYFIGTLPVRSPPLDCATCVSYQEFHCFSLVCTAQVDAYVDNCIASVRPSLCDSNIAALDTCLALLTATQQDTLAACMVSADGPPGCFACE